MSFSGFFQTVGINLEVTKNWLIFISFARCHFFFHPREVGSGLAFFLVAAPIVYHSYDWCATSLYQKTEYKNIRHCISNWVADARARHGIVR